jgi:cyclohexanecarboxylate-CoA ligase
MADRAAVPRNDQRLLPLREGETIVTVLYRYASALPNHPALMTRGFGRERTLQITYGQLLEHVERIADVLSLCGVRQGDAVAIQVPNCWGSATLLLACLRIGAVVVPVRQSIDEYELERTLAGTGASTCVVLDRYLGQQNAEKLLSVSARLPALRHRVVVGDAGATGALDFDQLCRDRAGVWQTDGEQVGPLPRDDDSPCLIVPRFADETLTTTGFRHRTLCADAVSAMGSAAEADLSQAWLTPGEVFGTSYPLNRHAGLMPAVWQPILAAGTGVFLDEWDAANGLDLFDEAEVTRMICPAEHWAELVAEQRLRPRKLLSLREAACRCPVVPPELAESVEEAFGLPLRVLPEGGAADAHGVQGGL